MSIRGNSEHLLLAAANLGRSQIFLGHEWPRTHNPSVDRQAGTLALDRCPAIPVTTTPDSRSRYDEAEAEESSGEAEEDDRLFALDYRTYLGLDDLKLTRRRPRHSDSRKQRLKSSLNAPSRILCPFTTAIIGMFSTRLRLMNCTSDGREVTLSSSHQGPSQWIVYPLTLDEQRKLDMFLEGNLRSGRIRPSKSPTASPFFFIKKKDGKLHPSGLPLAK